METTLMSDFSSSVKDFKESSVADATVGSY